MPYYYGGGNRGMIVMAFSPATAAALQNDFENTVSRFCGLKKIWLPTPILDFTPLRAEDALLRPFLYFLSHGNMFVKMQRDSDGLHVKVKVKFSRIYHLHLSHIFSGLVRAIGVRFACCMHI